MKPSYEYAHIRFLLSSFVNEKDYLTCGCILVIEIGEKLSYSIDHFTELLGQLLAISNTNQYTIKLNIILIQY